MMHKTFYGREIPVQSKDHNNQATPRTVANTLKESPLCAPVHLEIGIVLKINALKLNLAKPRLQFQNLSNLIRITL